MRCCSSSSITHSFSGSFTVRKGPSISVPVSRYVAPIRVGLLLLDLARWSWESRSAFACR
jgi:hypothetical protein